MISRQAVFGFGIGLLFSAVFFYAYPNPEPTPPELTPEDLQAAASKQHMVILSAEEYQELLRRASAVDRNAAVETAATTRETDNSEGAPAPPDVSGNGRDGQSAQPSTPGEQTVRNASETNEKKKQAAAPAPAKPSYRKTEDGVVVTITGGMTSSQIAELLATSGVIQDAPSFLQQLVGAEKHRSIRAGTYHFANGTEVQEVIHRLTTLPER